MTADIQKKGAREMSEVVAIEHLTLDGVMQGPARPDEDTVMASSTAGGRRPATIPP